MSPSMDGRLWTEPSIMLDMSLKGVMAIERE